MQLTVNLSDRAEVATAHALLAFILGDETAFTPPCPVIDPADNPATGMRPASEVFGQQPVQDAASVFGGAPAHLPQSVGSFADLLPSATAGADDARQSYIAPQVFAQSHATIAQGVPGVDLDKNGLPWDERIHAGTKGKTAKGEWKSKKGTGENPQFVTQVEAELRARMQSGGAVAPIPPAMPVIPFAQNAPTVAPPAQSSPVLTQLPQGPTAFPSEPTTFEQLMMRCTSAMTTGQLAPTALQAVCVQLGLGNAIALQANPQFVPPVWAQLKATTPGLQ